MSRAIGRPPGSAFVRVCPYPNPELWKWCSGCKAWKRRFLFNKSAATKDGMQPWCQACSSRDKRQRNGPAHKPFPTVAERRRQMPDFAINGLSRLARTIALAIHGAGGHVCMAEIRTLAVERPGGLLPALRELKALGVAVVCPQCSALISASTGHAPGCQAARKKGMQMRARGILRNRRRPMDDNTRALWQERLQGKRCVCGERKVAGLAFCYPCHAALPTGMNAKLADARGDDFLPAYAEAGELIASDAPVTVLWLISLLDAEKAANKTKEKKRKGR